jgi:hypothetical protein
MRKKIIKPVQQQNQLPDRDWLDLEKLAIVEMTSEDEAHPVESALLPGNTPGWLAAEPGEQAIRILFDEPQRLQFIRLCFEETGTERTQEYVLRWSPDGGKSFQEIVRQQWNFSPEGATTEIEEYQVELAGVTVLELSIIPDISGKNAIASLAQLVLA